MTRNSNTAADWISRAAKANPEGLLLVAAGLALLMRSSSKSHVQSSTYRPNYPAARQGMGGSAEEARDYMQDTARGAREYLSETTQGARQYVKDAADGARDYASGVAETVSSTAKDYVSTASEYANNARERFSEYAETATAQTARVGRQARTTLQNTIDRVVQDQPLAIGLAGLAAGAALAAAFPPTDMEKRTLGPAGETAADLAMRTGARVKDAGSKAGEKLVNAAQEHMKEVAQEAAGAFKDTLAGSDPAKQTGSTGSQPGSAQSPASDSRSWQSDANKGTSSAAGQPSWQRPPGSKTP